jgi:hypothetical protein
MSDTMSKSNISDKILIVIMISPVLQVFNFHKENIIK